MAKTRTPRSKSKTPSKAVVAVPAPEETMKPRASIPAIGEIVVHRYVPTHDDIARRAYELWMERGGRHGSHLEDWLLAEEQLKTHAA